VLRAHYRTPLEVTESTIADAEKGLARLDAMARRFALDDPLAAAPLVVAGEGPAAGAERGAVERFVERMDDDLDTPAALAGIFDLVSRANAAADAGDAEGGRRTARTAAVLAAALGLRLRGSVDVLDERTRQLVAQRDGARRDRDWARADALRDELVAEGWVVEDGPDGTTVHR
jgi:cysteinyl-tRNA synthetase